MPALRKNRHAWLSTFICQGRKEPRRLGVLKWNTTKQYSAPSLQDIDLVQEGDLPSQEEVRAMLEKAFQQAGGLVLHET